MLDGVSFTDPACTSLDDFPTASRSTTCRRRPTPGTSSAPWTPPLPRTAADRVPRRADALRPAFGRDGGRQPAGRSSAPTCVTGFSLPSNVAGLAGPGRGLDQRHVRRHDRTCSDQLLLRPAGSIVQDPDDASARPSGWCSRRPDPSTAWLVELTAAFFGLLAHINFATDVDEESTTCAASSEAATPSALRRSRRDQPVKLHNDTALSLDGKAPTGQSVGQHVCTG